MKKTISLVILFAFLYSCSNSKAENEKKLLQLTDESSILMDEQRSEMDKKAAYLKTSNEHIFNMTSAGATVDEIKELEKQKEIGLSKCDKKLKDIETKMDINSSKRDSIINIMK
jgi:hypothetical protein